MNTIAEKRSNGMQMQQHGKRLKLMRRNWVLYLFLVPTLIYAIMFWYAPMYGIVISFKNFRISKGILGSDWVGLKWFIKFFNSPRFGETLKNTLVLSGYTMLASFPFPIVLALMMNNIKNRHAKKFVQTVTYMPYFISTVVLVGMMQLFFSPYGGLFNTIMTWFGGSGNTYFMGRPEYFRHMYVWSNIWQTVGWNSIIYMAALSGVDQSLHEAAKIDGANIFQRVLHIDIPALMPTICILVILNFGNLMSIGYEKVYLMQNDLNIRVSEVITTYEYKVGLINREYSYSTAIGLFNSITNFALVVLVNKIMKKINGRGLW